MANRVPLDGVVVVELGGRIGAAVCGAVLAQLGATVVVLEGLHERDERIRHRAQLVAGKRSVKVAGADTASGGLVDQLVARCSVLIVSSDMDTRGQCYARWIADTMRIVCDVTAFGDSGPLMGQPYTDAQIQALTGILDTTGPTDAPPTPIRLPIVELMTGIYAAAACQAALRVMRQGGGGQRIDMSLYDCAFAAMSTFIPKLVSGGGGNVGRLGNRHAMAAPWNVYQARDGWVLLCAASDDQWRRIALAIGRPELGRDPRYLAVADRIRRADEVDAAMQDWIGKGSIERCLSALGAAGIPSGPVTKVEGFPREANLDHRQMIASLHDPVSDRQIWVPASPLHMSATPGLSPLRIPTPDEDRSEVVRIAREALPPSADANGDVGSAKLPLAGVRVLEIGHYTTAPLSARHLASLGADVIKIEPPTGEAVRTWTPTKNGIGYFFAYTNSDKRSLALDLETDAGISILGDLIGRSDVLIENLKPGALAKRGFSADALLRLNPRLVYCAVSGFGADTIYAGRPAFDSVIQAMSGIMDLTRAGDVPVKTGISCADIMGAEMAVVAILAAIEAREHTGLGQAIDLSMQDVAAWATMPLWNDMSMPPPTVIEAMDGFVVVELHDGNARADLPSDFPHEARLRMTRSELAAELRVRGWPAAPVLSVREMLEADQTRARNLVFSGRGADGEPWPLLASPLRLKGTPPSVRRPMTSLGSDRDAILAELGLSNT